MNTRQWTKVRPGYWVSGDSVVQIEILADPTAGASTSGLVWIITTN
jgi:hypothetical protein